ncbi:hypothetical protein [Pyrobaculum sp.]|uniref:hypothetical protein n=1 Tax=Pyrobaculum sp. TaxID=2004705 RepID=UPI003D09D900
MKLLVVDYEDSLGGREAAFQSTWAEGVREKARLPLTAEEGDLFAPLEEPSHVVLTGGVQLKSPLPSVRGVAFLDGEWSLFSSLFSWDCFKNDRSLRTALGALYYKYMSAISCNAPSQIVLGNLYVAVRRGYVANRRYPRLLYLDLLRLRGKGLSPPFGELDIASLLYPHIGIDTAPYICLLLHIYEPQSVYSDDRDLAFLARLCAPNARVYSNEPDGEVGIEKGAMAEVSLVRDIRNASWDEQLVIYIGRTAGTRGGFYKFYAPTASVSVFVRRATWGGREQGNGVKGRQREKFKN